MRAARVEAAALAAALLAACGTDVVRLQGHASAPPAKPACISFDLVSGAPCVYCGADYTVLRACLKCAGPTADASACQSCAWSDLPQSACKQCTDASGAVSTIGCDELRSDLKPPGS